MQQQKKITVLTHIHHILYELGLQPTDSGMFFTAYAVLNAYHQPELLRDVSRALYPTVAEHYDIDVDTVESSIEHTICQIHRTHKDALAALMGQLPTDVPHADAFLTAVIAQL